MQINTNITPKLNGEKAFVACIYYVVLLLYCVEQDEGLSLSFMLIFANCDKDGCALLRLTWLYTLLAHLFRYCA